MFGIPSSSAGVVRPLAMVGLTLPFGVAALLASLHGEPASEPA